MLLSDESGELDLVFLVLEVAVVEAQNDDVARILFLLLLGLPSIGF